MAAVLALIIASPLCCCAANCDGAPKAQSCCEPSASETSSTDRDSQPHICNCKSDEPRETAKKLHTKDLAKSLPPPSLAHAFELPPLKASLITIEHRLDPDHGPPRAMLSRYARWLN